MEATRYTPKEEYANMITHGIGMVLSIAAFFIILNRVLEMGKSRSIIGGLIFAATLLVMYTFSTLYHSVRTARNKRIFRMLDHIAIYLLIAGTYTPFMLVTLKDEVWGNYILWIIWTLAFLGIIYKTTALGRYKKFSLFLYLGMGWLVIFAAEPMIKRLPMEGLTLVISGGLSYTLGTIFYRWKKLPFHHAIWHLFVLGGSIFHFFAVFFYVI